MRSVSVTVNRSDRFPVGTSVGAYPRSGTQRGGHPSGVATETHVVGATGSCGPFTGLTADTPYTLYAEVEGAHRYVDVSDSTFTAPGNLRERIAAKRAAVGA